MFTCNSLRTHRWSSNRTTRSTFSVGAAEVSARLTLLDRDQIEPGERPGSNSACASRWRCCGRPLHRSPSVAECDDRGGDGDRCRPAPAPPVQARGPGGAGDAGRRDSRRDRAPGVGSAPREIDPSLVALSAGLSDGESGALSRLIATGDVRGLARHDEPEPRPGDFSLRQWLGAQSRAESERRLPPSMPCHRCERGSPKKCLKSRLKLSPPRLVRRGYRQSVLAMRPDRRRGAIRASARLRDRARWSAPGDCRPVSCRVAWRAPSRRRHRRSLVSTATPSGRWSIGGSWSRLRRASFFAPADDARSAGTVLRLDRSRRAADAGGFPRSLWHEPQVCAGHTGVPRFPADHASGRGRTSAVFAVWDRGGSIRNRWCMRRLRCCQCLS